MKHCPNTDCSDRLSTGSAAEYRDEIDSCASCGSVLSEGPARRADETPLRDDDPPVTIATFSSPHEAHMASAALASHGIESFVQHDHGQYTTMGSWVHVQVALRNRDLAAIVLERGPARETDSDGGAAGSPEAPASDRTDDMRELRLQRRLTLGRWVLYAGAAGTLPYLLFFVPLFVVPLGLALWSRSQPRRAFAVALGLQTVVVFVAVATSGPTGLLALFPWLAFYYAWMAAAPNPPEALLAGPVTPAIDIDDAWQVPIVAPPERPIRLARPLALAAALVVALWGGWLVFRALGILDAP